MRLISPFTWRSWFGWAAFGATLGAVQGWAQGRAGYTGVWWYLIGGLALSVVILSWREMRLRALRRRMEDEVRLVAFFERLRGPRRVPSPRHPSMHS